MNKLKLWKQNNSWHKKMKDIYKNKLATIHENYSYYNFRNEDYEKDENKYTKFILTTAEHLKINDTFAEEHDKIKFIIGKIKHIFYAGQNLIIFIQNNKSIYMYNKQTIIYKVVI